MQPDNNSSAMQTGYYGGLAGSNPGGQNPQGFGSIIGSWWNDISGASANNKFAAAESYNAWLRSEASAQANRDFQERMSNTSYQRAVADMQAAGINPAALSGDGNLNPAGTPGGAAGQAHGASASSGGANLGSIIGQIASVAIGKSLMAKFTNAGMAAADKHELVAAKIKSMAANELTSAKKAESYKNLNDAREKWSRYTLQKAQEGDAARTKKTLDNMKKQGPMDAMSSAEWDAIMDDLEQYLNQP